MAHVSFIHGIANKPEGGELLHVWLRALDDDGPMTLRGHGAGQCHGLPGRCAVREHRRRRDSSWNGAVTLWWQWSARDTRRDASWRHSCVTADSLYSRVRNPLARVEVAHIQGHRTLGCGLAALGAEGSRPPEDRAANEGGIQFIATTRCPCSQRRGSLWQPRSLLLPGARSRHRRQALARPSNRATLRHGPECPAAHWCRGAPN